MSATKKRLTRLFAVLVALCMAILSPVVASAALTVISVNGTRPSEYFWPDSGLPDDTDTVLQGYFANHDNKVVIDYRRDAGILTDFDADAYDVSVDEGVTKTVEAVKLMRAVDPTGHIDVVGQSQGADVVWRTIKVLEDDGYDTSNITFWVVGDVNNPDGGLLSRFTFLDGVYIPFIGITYAKGKAEVQYSNVIRVTKEFDGAADLPAYLFNPFSWINAGLGSLVYDRHTYKDVDIHDPNNIVKTNADGTVTTILIPNPDGQLAITRPLADLGFPDLAWALDPFARAVINTGYDRSYGTYPDQPVGLRLFPEPDKWIPYTVSVIQGLAETVRRLGVLVWRATVDLLQPPPVRKPETVQQPEPDGDSDTVVSTDAAATNTQDQANGLRERLSSFVTNPSQTTTNSEPPNTKQDSFESEEKSDPQPEPEDESEQSEVEPSDEQEQPAETPSDETESSESEESLESEDEEEEQEEPKRNLERPSPKFSPSGGSVQNRRSGDGIRDMLDRVHQAFQPDKDMPPSTEKKPQQADVSVSQSSDSSSSEGEDSSESGDA